MKTVIFSVLFLNCLVIVQSEAATNKTDCADTDPNSKWLDCGPSCGKLTCETLTGIGYGGEEVVRQLANVKCRPRCGPPGCHCRQGYVLGENEKCVKERDCPQLDCTRHERVNQCGLKCEKACEPDPAPCQSTCPGPPACSCKKHHIRDKKTNKCIPQRECDEKLKKL